MAKKEDPRKGKIQIKLTDAEKQERMIQLSTTNEEVKDLKSEKKSRVTELNEQIRQGEKDRDRLSEEVATGKAWVDANTHLPKVEPDADEHNARLAKTPPKANGKAKKPAKGKKSKRAEARA